MENNYIRVDTIIQNYVTTVIRPTIHNKKSNEDIDVTVIYNTGSVEGLRVDKNKILYKNKNIQLPLITFERVTDSMSEQNYNKINYSPNKRYGFYVEKTFDTRTNQYNFVKREIPISMNIDYDCKIFANTMNEMNIIKNQFLLHNSTYWISKSSNEKEIQGVYVTFDSFTNSGGNADKSRDSFYESTFSIQAKANFFVQPKGAEQNRDSKKIYHNKTTLKLK